MSNTFKALLVIQPEKKVFTRTIVERQIDDLPAGELLVLVHYSSLNFKDALSAMGNPGVTRNYPHTPGIDAAGEVLSCSDGSFVPGDQVIVTSYDLGMDTDGGFGQIIRVPSQWALKLPVGLSLRESMMLGTAGLTAALSIYEIEQGVVKPEDGPILVTGATGGVGSLAVAILAKAGYQVVAATGKMTEADYLKSIGAADVIERNDVTQGSERPMMKPLWAGVVDCVGGEMLAAAIKSTKPGGIVTCCGLVGSSDLSLNVFPFILRGVRLIGIDSAECPMTHRTEVWRNMATKWKLTALESMVEEVGLEGLEDKIQSMLKGGLKRRILVRLS
ncbi:YhdH/YhfP family quinone oxidoreductase [Pelobacter propionicus]|uniref:Alcohol dehydrogenase, zinc-binding domain protein n=1 Tax=Pelobacter propionicus (strain DSM 2379 / NBRC 103807 / OttBd1) TaxID=338966 RepID=A1AN15_PELPD|nr:YhdH/YhfP family quinone oxidoreductase [Pelobacter propionicus]ABK98735.1 Alcohol dehydrogenase, zinc-binding domain protein [Pelobacter propionicus DSM 2379]